MAHLHYGDRHYTDHETIAKILGEENIPFERWDLPETDSNQQSSIDDNTVLKAHQSSIERLKSERGYVTSDLVALSEKTPNLGEITKKFDQEHHHSEDEVRFTVEGAGVFEINGQSPNTERLRLTTEPGDLLVIPAGRRHLFYLTDAKHIRCIRLFKDPSGWEAIY